MVGRRPEYVLIGPVGVGKSTLGERLARRLGLPHVALDAIAHEYYGAAPGWNGHTYHALMAESLSPPTVTGSRLWRSRLSE